MKPMLMVVLLAFVGAIALAQTHSDYQPAVPVAPQVYGGGGGWGWGGGSGASTAAGSAMQGMASVVNAAGNYNLSTSAAAINMTQAQKQEIQNWSSYTNTYFDLRALNRKQSAEALGKPVSEEFIQRTIQAGAPKPLTGQQMDPLTGKIFWPDTLQDPKFQDQRGTLDAAFAERAKYGALPSQDARKVRTATQTMLGELEDMIQTLAPEDYMSAKRFIQSLASAASKPAA
jgi:hypothetical protein